VKEGPHDSSDESPSALLAQHLRQAVGPITASERLFVAYSGGPDSTALLHEARTLWPTQVVALHAHHGLLPAADAWSQHCQSICDAWNVPLHTVKLNVENAGQGVEAAARQARYAWFESCLGEGERLLLAHHQDDQAETLLLRLLRGTGPQGLGAMARERPLGRGRLLRPFLALPRSVIQAYIEVHKLRPVTDPSNTDPQYDRSYLRHRIMPLLEARWPAYAQRFASAAELQREQNGLVALRALATIHSVVGDPGFALGELPEERAESAYLIRQWLQQWGLAMPSRVRLAEFLRQLGGGRGALLQTPTWSLERYRDAVYLYRPSSQPVPPTAEFHPGDYWREDAVGAVQIRGEASPGTLHLRFRKAGDRLRGKDGHRRSLKNLYQSMGVPPWWRERVPLLTTTGPEGEVLLSVGGLARSGQAQELDLDIIWTAAVYTGDAPHQASLKPPSGA